MTAINFEKRNRCNARLRYTIGALKTRLAQIIPAHMLLPKAAPNALGAAYNEASTSSFDAYRYFDAKRKRGIINRLIHIIESSPNIRSDYNMALAVV